MIQEAYVSFETAKLLKEKGFRQGCEHFYESGVLDRTKENEFMYNQYGHLISSPTQQMALAWLREKKNVYMDIAPTHVTNGSIHFVWQTYDSDYAVTGDCDRFFDSYEEAVEAAIKYCLENLI